MSKSSLVLLLVLCGSACGTETKQLNVSLDGGDGDGAGAMDGPAADRAGDDTPPVDRGPAEVASPPDAAADTTTPDGEPDGDGADSLVSDASGTEDGTGPDLPLSCAPECAGCTVENGVSVCQCPTRSGSDVFVDPVAGSDTPTAGGPTGAQSPPECRFRTIGKAIGALAGPGRVVVITENPPADLSGESFPLTVPAQVRIEGSGPVPETYKIRVPAGVARAVILSDGAVLSGLSVILDPADATLATAVSCAKGTVTLDGVRILATTKMATGLVLGEESVACNAALSNLQVEGFSAGILINLGAVTAHAVVATKNGLDGMRVRGGGVTVTGESRFNENDRDGIRVDRGTLTSTGLSANKNKLNGVHTRGGTVVLHRVSLDDNLDLGLYSVGAQTTIDDGSHMNGNVASGVRVEGGHLIVGGETGEPVELSRNGLGTTPLYGVNIDGPGAGSKVDITRAIMRENGGFGIKVLLQTPDGLVTVKNSDIANNRLGGIVVREAASTNVGDYALVVDGVRIVGNGSGDATGIGIHLRGDGGDLTTLVKNTVIKENGDVAILFEQGATFITRLWLERNEIFSNNLSAGRTAGGIRFATAGTLAGFVGNKIRDNRGAQLEFNAPANGGAAWELNSPGGCGGPDSTNHLACYGAGGTGIRVSGASPVTVDARNIGWQSGIPVAGADVITQGAAHAVTLDGPCPVAGLVCLGS